MRTLSNEAQSTSSSVSSSTGDFTVTGNLVGNSAVIRNTSSTATNSYTQISLVTENNAMDVGLDPQGNAIVASLTRPMSVYGPNNTSGLQLTTSTTSVIGNLVANGAYISNLVAGALTVSGPSVSYTNGDFTTLTSTVSTLETIMGNNAAFSNVVANTATVVGNATIGIDAIVSGNVTAPGGTISNLRSTVVSFNDRQMRFMSGGDNRVLNIANGTSAPNVNGVVAAWFSLGFGDSFSNGTNPPINALVNCRDGSFASRNFISSIGSVTSGSNANLQTYQNNAAYFSYGSSVSGGATLFTNRRNGTGPGGWMFMPQAPTGAMEYAGTPSFWIDQSGNLYANNVGLFLNTGPTTNITMGVDSGNTTSTNSVFIGRSAGNVCAGTNSIAIGYFSNCITNNSTVIGAYAKAIFGDSVSIGFQAGGRNSRVTAVGTSAASLSAGADGVCIGFNAGIGVGSGSIFIGSGTGSVNASGPHNIVLGFNSGNALTSGANNIIIGTFSTGTAALSNSILIGAGIPSMAADGLEVVYLHTPALGNIIRANTRTMTIGGRRGMVAIGTNNPTANLHVEGNVYANGLIFATGTITQGSDARVKGNMSVIDANVISMMRGYTYDRLDIGTRDAGLIAQDVAKGLPEAVVPSPDGNLLSISYAGVVGALINAVNNLRARVEYLESRYLQN
jgi:hypothetical protein